MAHVLLLVLLALALVLAGAFTGTIVLYLVAWYEHVNFACRTDEGEWRRRIRPWPILKGVILESLAVFFLCITYPLRFYYDRIPRRPVPSDRPPILMIHGWGCAGHSFMIIRSALMRAGYPNVYAMSYGPVMADAGKLSRQAAEKIEQVLRRTGAKRVILITHSMGGVLSRYAIKNLGMNGKVEKVIALGGPHMGSRIASFMTVGKNTLQMTYRSRFVTDLAEGGMTPGDAKYVSIYSGFDNFVLPPDSSDLGPGARNITVPYHGHVYLLYSPMVIRLIRDELGV